MKWYQSKTIAFNLIMILLGLVAYLQSIATFNKWAVALGVITTVGNLVLRYFFTSQPIT